MKTKVPESLKADMPANRWGKILGATPVVLTVVATLLAGLSSGEMTQAQYSRSLAAQLQAKAGDQWNFFQGKKLRSAVQRSALDQIAAGGRPAALDHASLVEALQGTPAASVIEADGRTAAETAMIAGTLPARPVSAPPPPDLQAALDALESGGVVADPLVRLLKAQPSALSDALQQAYADVRTFDEATGPIGKAIDLVERHARAVAGRPGLARDVIAARIAFHAQRYDLEAQLNQRIAFLYELQVQASNIKAERHHHRSQRFFYGMLAAQAGVVISTLAMAARQRNLLWSLAAAAGAIAIAFAVYVYLYV
ncbi:MAG: hypothetical protein JNN01_25975 [Opitutaceae bacterium]|nr:hypothetical protein [Opitutaceae bacterium]